RIEDKSGQGGSEDARESVCPCNADHSGYTKSEHPGHEPGNGDMQSSEHRYPRTSSRFVRRVRRRHVDATDECGESERSRIDGDAPPEPETPHRESGDREKREAE